MSLHHRDLSNAGRLTGINGPGTDTYGDASGVWGNASRVWGDLTGLTGDLSVLLDTYTFSADSEGDVSVLQALDELGDLTEWEISGNVPTCTVKYLAEILLNPEESDTFDPKRFDALVEEHGLVQEALRYSGPHT